MAVHAYHDGLAGYDPSNVLHDGCEECEGRAADGIQGLQALDETNFARLLNKMVDAEFIDDRYPETISHADATLCGTLYAIAVLLERHFKIDPEDLPLHLGGFSYPKTTTGRVGSRGDLPIRMVTLNDARVITIALNAYKQIHTLSDGDPDIVDRLDRIILELDAPA
jgi:hypothetical protein